MILVILWLIKRREQGWTIGFNWANGEHCRCCGILTRTASSKGIHSPPTPWAKESATAAAHGNTERWGHGRGAYHWTQWIYQKRNGAGWAWGAAAPHRPPPPQILGNKIRFGQSQVLKTFPCFFSYFEEINIFYFNLKKILKSP